MEDDFQSSVRRILRLLMFVAARYFNPSSTVDVNLIYQASFQIHQKIISGLEIFIGWGCLVCCWYLKSTCLYSNSSSWSSLRSQLSVHSTSALFAKWWTYTPLELVYVYSERSNFQRRTCPAISLMYLRSTGQCLDCFEFENSIHLLCKWKERSHRSYQWCSCLCQSSSTISSWFRTTFYGKQR